MEAWKDVRVAQDLHAQLSNHLKRIASIFKPGAKVTLVVRHPSIPDGSADVVIGDDDYDSVITTIKQLRKRPAVPA